MSWNHSDLKASLKRKPNLEFESRDIENSLLMILFEHLDLAIPEGSVLNCQPIDSPFT